MKEIYDVEIHCSNGAGKEYVYQRDCETMIDVTRLLLMYTPKKNYHVVEIFCSLRARLF